MKPSPEELESATIALDLAIRAGLVDAGFSCSSENRAALSWHMLSNPDIDEEDLNVVVKETIKKIRSRLV